MKQGSLDLSVKIQHYIQMPEEAAGATGDLLEP